MSTGNDPALPADTTQPASTTVAEAAVAAVTAEGGADKVAEGGLKFTGPQPVDVDDVELNAAKTAAQAENTAGQGDGKDGAATGKDPAQPTAGAAQTDPKLKDGQTQPQGQQPAGDQPMIPKARFDEVNGAKTEAERKAAYWQGVAEARAQAAPGQPGGTAQAQQQQPTPEQRLAIIHAAQDALAVRFDNGELTRAEEVKQRRELDNQEATLREEALTAKLRPAAQAAQPAANDELYLDTLTAQLETQHPWVRVATLVTGSDQDWDYVKGRAIDNLTARGVDPRAGNVGKYELRKEMATLWDQLGPTLVGERAKAQGIALPGAQATPGATQQQAQPLSPTAQARQNGLDKAAGAPPDLSRMSGHTGDANGQPSDARLETMTDDEIGALPVSARNKILGISAA